jgi:Na+/citrate or Na+/malate symporter
MVVAAAIGGLVGLLFGAAFRRMLLVRLFGACAGALQLSWFWLPYAVRAGRGKSTLPLVVAAVVISTVIGAAAPWTMFAILRPRVD